MVTLRDVDGLPLRLLSLPCGDDARDADGVLNCESVTYLGFLIELQLYFALCRSKVCVFGGRPRRFPVPRPVIVLAFWYDLLLFRSYFYLFVRSAHPFHLIFNFWFPLYHKRYRFVLVFIYLRHKFSATKAIFASDESKTNRKTQTNESTIKHLS